MVMIRRELPRTGDVGRATQRRGGFSYPSPHSTADRPVSRVISVSA